MISTLVFAWCGHADPGARILFLGTAFKSESPAEAPE